MEAKDNPFSLQAIQVYSVTILFYAVVYMVLMILPFYSLSIGASQAEIGLIMGVTMFTSMFARPIAGTMVDRHGASKVFVIALFVFMISLLGYFVPNLWAFGIIRLVQGVVAAFFSTAMEIVTIELLSSKVRGQGLSLYSLATMVPSTFGPAVALWLKDIVPMAWIFGLFLAMGVANFIFSIVVSRKVGARQVEKKHVVREPGLWKSRVLVVSSGIMMLASVANGAIFTFLPLYLESNHSTYGSLYFLVQTLTLVACRFVGRKYIPSDGTLPQGLVVSMAGLAMAGSLLISLWFTLPVLVIAAVCNGIAFAMLYPSLLTFVSFSVPDHARGFLLGLFIGAADLGFALGALVMGPLADWFSYRTMWLTCVAMLVVAGVLPLLYKRGRAGALSNQAING
ncbi:MAG: MFS transporter [Tumebacillaceae bacterium]